ncbi:MAG: peptide chain release factor N(5)-glutamine methyltransferase [Pseudomonadota bacterium]
MTVAEAIRSATAELEATSDTARLDAELLMAHALGVSRSDMLLRTMDEAAPSEFFCFIGRRAKHEPVAYINGTQEFYGREFEVSRDVLIPRPDSEILIETALEFCEEGFSVLDIGTGSGALLLTLLQEYPSLKRGFGIDNSPAAIEIARKNARKHELKNAHFGLFDWRPGQERQGLGYAHDTYEIYLCNPPYVETTAKLDPQVADYEPHSALFAGKDGLDDYRLLIPELIQATGTGNGITVILEIGATQADEVTWLAEKEGYDVELRKDLAGRPRCLVLR